MQAERACKAGLTRTLGVTIVHPSTFHVTGRLTTRMMKHPPNQNSSSSHSMNNKRALLGAVAGHRLEALYRHFKTVLKKAALPQRFASTICVIRAPRC
jgi:hypothetical protein